jgi:hypothetical protein
MIHVFQRDCVLSQLVREDCLQANTPSLSRVTSFISDAPAYWVLFFFLWKERKNKGQKQWVKEGRQDASYNSTHTGKYKRATYTWYIPILFTLKKEMDTGPSQSVVKHNSVLCLQTITHCQLYGLRILRHISLTTKWSQTNLKINDTVNGRYPVE